MKYQRYLHKTNLYQIYKHGLYEYDEYDKLQGMKSRSSFIFTIFNIRLAIYMNLKINLIQYAC